MNKELKKAIIESIFNNINDFQLVNNMMLEYKDYIYDKEGNYLIGGKKVSNFINDAVKLIIE